MQYERLDDLKYIKKHYGENMSHLCRELFPSILECPGLLYYIVSSRFNKSRELYDDIVKEHKEALFKEYIYNFINVEEDEEESTKNVIELLDEVGYVLYECKTHEDILRFRKYYAPGEELCTFGDSHRIDNHYIFFIVKKNVDEIKRENFKNPKREDEYSTSVLDLQFDKGEHQRVSIKSRYNHKVNNPDATYSNNLDSIVPGLTKAFEKDLEFNIGNEYKSSFELDHYVKSRDGKYYKYNYEIDNIHYCPNNIIIHDGWVIDNYIDKGRYTLLDYFILDTKEKKIFFYDREVRDSFLDELKMISNIKINNIPEGRKIEIVYEYNKQAIIKIDKDNRIIGYENNNITKCDKSFLVINETLSHLSLPNLKECEDEFLYSNKSLKELSLPNLEKCGREFVHNNEGLREVFLPKLEYCSAWFLYSNNALKYLYLPNLEMCDSGFLHKNTTLESVILPKLIRCEEWFLVHNRSLKEICLPELKWCGGSFIFDNEIMKNVFLPNLGYCADKFLYSARKINKLYMPAIRHMGSNSFYSNESVNEYDLSSLEDISDGTFRYNPSLRSELNNHIESKKPLVLNR